LIRIFESLFGLSKNKYIKRMVTGTCASDCSEKKQRNIVIISTSKNRPVGGEKVLYKLSQSLNEGEVDSWIFLPRKKYTNPTWFDHDASVRYAHVFRPECDFLIIPETVAKYFCDWLVFNKFKYAIYVQNPFILFDARDDFYRVKKVYKNASLILTVSQYTEDFISLVLGGETHKKITRISPYISLDFLFKRPLRERDREFKIAFMPRKLPKHALDLVYLLKELIPIEWSFMQIDQVTEEEVIDRLKSSSIFLSFSEQEGFGLPPLEAALLGNIVIGYAGQGGNEFFKAPIFRRIENGDYVGFIDQVIHVILEIQSGFFLSREYVNAHRELMSSSSHFKTREQLDTFEIEVKEVMGWH